MNTRILILLLALTPAAAAGTFVPEFVDGPSSITATQFTDIDVDAAGAPWVAYTGEIGAGNARVYIAWKSGDTWQDDNWNVGPYVNFCAMDLDANGDAHIAVQGNAAPDLLLVYLHYSGGTWSADIPELPNTVTGDTLVGDWPDIVVDSGFVPWISYGWRDDYNAAEGDLRLAFKSGADWTIETVDGGPDDVGEYTSIALSALERPRIAYYDRGNGNLMYARRSGTGTWVLELVDDLPDVGTWTDIAVGPDGDIHISYINEITRAVRYARRTSGVWATEAVPDGTHSAGDGTSIDVDANGDPHIAYYYGQAQRLRHIWKTGGTWHSEPVDTSADRVRPALVLDHNDEPHVSYMEETDQDVWYAAYDPGTGVPVGPPSAALSLRVYPNPAAGGAPVRIEYASDKAAGGAAELAVYDLAGRRVRTLFAGGAARGAATWDGRADGGAPAPAGTYVVRYARDGDVVSRRVQMMR